MSESLKRDIAWQILEELDDAWERHTGLSLNLVQEQGGWEKNTFRTVVDTLEHRHGFIQGAGSSYSFEIPPSGVLYAEENGIVTRDKAAKHERIRQHTLTVLADLYDREGNRAHIHYEKIAGGLPFKTHLKF